MISHGQTEAMIAHDPLIGYVVMFSHAHIEPEIRVEPAADHTVDLRGVNSVKAFIDVIWFVRQVTSIYSIGSDRCYPGRAWRKRMSTRHSTPASIKRYGSSDRSNATATYFMCAPQMIIIASPLKPFEHTAKGTARREVCLKLYASEIDALYAGEQDALAAQDREFPDFRKNRPHYLELI